MPQRGRRRKKEKENGRFGTGLSGDELFQVSDSVVRAVWLPYGGDQYSVPTGTEVQEALCPRRSLTRTLRGLDRGWGAKGQCTSTMVERARAGRLAFVAESVVGNDFDEGPAGLGRGDERLSRVDGEGRGESRVAPLLTSFRVAARVHVFVGRR